MNFSGKHGTHRVRQRAAEERDVGGGSFLVREGMRCKERVCGGEMSQGGRAGVVPRGDGFCAENGGGGRREAGGWSFRSSAV